MEELTLFDNHLATVTYLEGDSTIVCKLNATYVPMVDFQVIFLKIGEFVEQYRPVRMIFDKSRLTTFHQPSMEWYHVYWKEKMYELGLSVYRKILPQDDFFVQSVNIGRQKIRQNNPSFDFNKYDIQYFDSYEKALDG